MLPNPLVRVQVRCQLISGSHSENVSALAHLLYTVTEYRLFRMLPELQGLVAHVLHIGSNYLHRKLIVTRVTRVRCTCAACSLALV